MTAASTPATDPLTRMVSLGAHLMPLSPGLKTPTAKQWQLAAALTVADAQARLNKGGNLGVNLASSRMICLDAENTAAAEAVVAAAFSPTVVPAKAQDPASAKHGGSHTWLRIPDGIDAATLPSDAMGIKLPDGGIIDVLAGRRYAVAPPSRLHEAPGYFYAPAKGGPLDLASDGADITEAPLWLFDSGVACPPGLEPLHGCLAPKTIYERVEADARSIDLTDRIDSVPWEAWIDGDPRLVPTGETDGCGCEIWHFAGADNIKSVTLHSGCGQGCGAHIWSGTMIGQLELDGDHLSRLDLSVALRGVSRREAAASVGIELGGKLSAITPDDFDDAAAGFERDAEGGEVAVAAPGPNGTVVRVVVGQDGLLARATRCRAAAAAMRAEQRVAGAAAGEIYGASPIAGGDSVGGGAAGVIDAEIVEQTVPVSASGVPAVDDAIEGEIVTDWEDGDQAMWTRHREIEAELRGERDPETGLRRGMVPCLGRMANIAESRGIYLLGFIEACLPRVSARVPANVLLTPRADSIREKAEGVGLGYNAILLGPPATGKTTTQTAAAGAVPLPEGITQCAAGSAEGVIKKARSIVGKDTRATVHATSVYVETDEVTSQTKDLKRDGSMYAAFINSAFFGGTMVGMTASEKARNGDIPAHSTRFAQQIGAQPQLCGPIVGQAGSGLTARFAWAFTGSVDESALGPLYGKPVPALLPQGLPWDPPTGIPFGYRPYSGPAAGDGEDDAPIFEVENIEDFPAEWIVVPRDPEEVAAARAVAARRSRRTRAALTEDRESGRTSGHDFVRIEKTAALLAFMDGIKQPTEEYVAAAKLLAEATALAAAEAKIQSDSEDDAQAKKDGRKRGIEYATGNAVAKQEATDAVAAAAEALYAKLTRPVSGLLVKGKLAKGFGGTATYGELAAAKSVRPEHRPHRDAAMDLLIQQRRVTVSGSGDDRRAYIVTVSTRAIAAVPSISRLSA